MHIILDVPDELGEKLQQLGDRLPELLNRVLAELSPQTAQPLLPERISADELQILDILASQPSPETVLALRPNPHLQARMSDLLARRKSEVLTRDEEAEIDRYLLIEHWVRLAKAHAYKRLQSAA